MSDQITAVLITAGLFGAGLALFAVAVVVERSEWLSRALDAWLGDE